MTKRSILLLFLCISTLKGKTQFLTQSAEGKGAVILPLNGVAVGFDIGKSEITVGANNYSKALSSSNSTPFKNWFIGGNLSVKNSSGIGNLFQSGDIVPAGNFYGFLGFNINNNKSLLDAWKSSGVVAANKREQEKLRILFESYRSDIADYIKESLPFIEDETFRTSKGQDLIKKVSESPDAFALRRIIVAILADKDKRLEAFNIAFKALLEPRQRIYYESYSRDDETKAINLAFSDFIDNHTVLRLTPFVFGGIDARNFSLYTGLNTTSLGKSFTDTLYRGGVFGVGMNAQIGNVWLGVTYAYVDGDNFSSNLISKEYTLRTTDASGNQELISEKKITGYSGKYAKVASNQLNIDLLKEFALGDTSRLITNLYYRGSMASRDTAYLKNISNLGLGLYFLGSKSKFLGGLYVELPDINNNIEMAKPEAERSIRPPLKKLTFGVVTRFSINSIIGFVNRPRKPDS
ncbi:hypothetical protein [Telluribacter sp. SYSU D00476]|uniref:hypothetical protein n=1 Tax=Telluribacter sp. SYSU D00476 TaxID=2811430 RepID=UPI001FF28FAA|nr:hypothetical protein [Telluribacter sp. SYSU D00476]